MAKYILAIDSGTTGNRAILFDRDGNVASMEQREFRQLYPNPGWVEQEPVEIWETQLEVILKLLKKRKITPREIAGIGITNQRETTIIWERKTGNPIYNAIVWQDRRTAGICDKLKSEGLEKKFTEKTGLVLDAYFSGTKIKWILDNVEGARELAEAGKLAFGTIDSWLVWNLTAGKVHITDVTNASRTLLFNIHSLKWDDELLALLDIPHALLPEVRQSSEIYCYTHKNIMGTEIPVAGIAGDQQAALFGQMCTRPGMIKNTYGTGCFVVMNTGPKPVASKHRLLTTVAWQIQNETVYALEGSIFIAGAVVQWLRDEMGIINASSEIEELALKVNDNGGITFVPAMVGLGAPHWDAYAAGMLIGIGRNTTKAHIARAALEAIALRTMEVVESMEDDAGMDVSELRVDGGASVNNLLMQIQANVINKPVVRPQITETTALGAAYLAGLASGFWSMEELTKHWKSDRLFKPDNAQAKNNEAIANWRKAVERSKGWYDSR